MTKRLFMICPTDNIESLIRQKFDGQKYFYTSLGNSFNIDKNELEELLNVVQKHDIEEITFIISENNKIIIDATQRQKFADIRGLKINYQKINEKRNLTKQMWSSHDQHVLFLSYYLKEKIHKFREHLCNHSMSSLRVNGKIYSQAYNSFRRIYPELSLSNTIRIN